MGRTRNGKGRGWSFVGIPFNGIPFNGMLLYIFLHFSLTTTVEGSFRRWKDIGDHYRLLPLEHDVKAWEGRRKMSQEHQRTARRVVPYVHTRLPLDYDINAYSAGSGTSKHGKESSTLLDALFFCGM